MSTDLRLGIVETARALGIDPVDLATAISYETAGTFDPMKRGPTTQWGQHRGLIQFGEPQAKRYGVDWENPVGSQLGKDGAVANYLRDTGVKPGMGLLDVYSAINAGGVGRYDRSDANNGGAPGTVADKVNSQMGGHRRKALALLGDMSAFNVADGPKGQEEYLRFNPNQPTQLSQFADGPKGQEMYTPVMGSPPAMPQTMVAGATPTMPTSLPSVSPTGGMADIFGMFGGMQSQPTQFSDGRVMGPTAEQATGLAQLVEALKSRMI